MFQNIEDISEIRCAQKYRLLIEHYFYIVYVESYFLDAQICNPHLKLSVHLCKAK